MAAIITTSCSNFSENSNSNFWSGPPISNSCEAVRSVLTGVINSKSV